MTRKGFIGGMGTFVGASAVRRAFAGDEIHFVYTPESGSMVVLKKFSISLR